MSTQIDWSKAPEEATHWDSRGNCCSVGFMKPGVRRGEWEYFGMGGHWILYGPVDGALGAAMVKRPADTSWAGEGLPPVGTVCEANNGGDSEYFKCMVVGTHYKTGRPIIDTNSMGAVLTHAPSCWKFRPIRTPEQIASEERESHINGMLCHDALGGTRRGLAEALYDAGYRKPTP